MTSVRQDTLEVMTLQGNASQPKIPSERQSLNGNITSVFMLFN